MLQVCGETQNSALIGPFGFPGDNAYVGVSALVPTQIPWRNLLQVIVEYKKEYQLDTTERGR